MISAVILTFNEEVHIKRCIESILPVVERIYILDSYSTDKTIQIASMYDNVQIAQNKFTNHASQFNYALDFFDINSEWIMRIDADEIIDLECTSWLATNIKKIPNEVTGIYFNRYMMFLNKLLKYGGMSSYWMLRLWRNGYGRCEQRWMDEHIVISQGRTIHSRGKLIDNNLNSLGWWAHKHVNYSTREAIDILVRRNTNSNLNSNLVGQQSERIRFLKLLYNRFPLFVRPFLYFLYRYILRVGFLDGKQGFLWCLLQGFWYRMMVDAKVYEITSESKRSNSSIEFVIKNKYGYEV